MHSPYPALFSTTLPWVVLSGHLWCPACGLQSNGSKVYVLCFVTLNTSPKLSGPQFPHTGNGDNKGSCLL